MRRTANVVHGLHGESYEMDESHVTAGSKSQSLQHVMTR